MQFLIQSMNKTQQNKVAIAILYIQRQVLSDIYTTTTMNIAHKSCTVVYTVKFENLFTSHQMDCSRLLFSSPTGESEVSLTLCDLNLLPSTSPNEAVGLKVAGLGISRFTTFSRADIQLGKVDERGGKWTRERGGKESGQERGSGRYWGREMMCWEWGGRRYATEGREKEEERGQGRRGGGGGGGVEEGGQREGKGGRWGVKVRERGSVMEGREGSEVVRWDVSGKREREGRCGREGGRRELSGHACE